MKSLAAAIVRENIEAFAVAIAMALGHPALLPGSVSHSNRFDEANTLWQSLRAAGRAVVTAIASSSTRSATCCANRAASTSSVFQYPLNRNRNFIKRIAGLGGEWLRLIDGDIWVSRDEGKNVDDRAQARGRSRSAVHRLLPGARPTDAGNVVQPGRQLEVWIRLGGR